MSKKNGNKKEGNLPISDVSKRFFELRRNNLQKMKKNKNINNISIYDFKNNAITYEQIRKAEKIIFIDDDKTVKILKSKY